MLTVRAEEEALHEDIGRVADTLGRLPEESTPVDIPSEATSQPESGPTSVGARTGMSEKHYEQCRIMVSKGPPSPQPTRQAPTLFYNQDADKRTVEDVLEETIGTASANPKLISHRIARSDHKNRQLVF